MPNIGALFSGTPAWVWGAFLFVLYRGIRALRPSTIPVWQVYIVPALILGINLVKFSLHFAWAYPGYVWAIGYGIGFIAGTMIGVMLRVGVNKQAGTITVPGTTFTLIMLIIFFAVHYYFGYMMAVSPLLKTDTSFLAQRLLVSSGIAGLFLGRAQSFVAQYQRAC